MSAGTTGSPQPRTVTQRRQLAQNVRHLLDDYRYAKAMDWPDAQREGDLRLALGGVLRLMELEGMTDLEEAQARLVETRQGAKPDNQQGARP